MTARCHGYGRYAYTISIALARSALSRVVSAPARSAVVLLRSNLTNGDARILREKDTVTAETANTPVRLLKAASPLRNVQSNRA